MLSRVNIAYKIIQDITWTHSIVTRPVRKIVKLFELGDTTFGDEMKAAHQAAQEILLQRGLLDEIPAEAGLHGSVATKVASDAFQGLQLSESPKNYLNDDMSEAGLCNKPLLSYLQGLNPSDWFNLSENLCLEKELDSQFDFEHCEVSEFGQDSEIMFLV